MSGHAVYHIVKADFLERVRGYKFLVILGLMVLVSYLFVPKPNASYVTIDLGGYRGIYNSAWIGASVALLVAGYLGPLGFFAVKGAVNRDRANGVGQIIAATPITKRAYVFGKWLSNMAVLTAMTTVVLISSVVLQLIRAEDRTIDPLTLAAPFLVIVLPTMALIAALALLFETIPALRGGLGNVVFVLVWIVVGFPLALGGSMVLANMEDGARAAVAGYDGGSNCCLILESNAREMLGRELGVQQTFVWDGMDWTAANLLLHLAIVVVALGVVVPIAARKFDRFAGTHAGPGRLNPMTNRARTFLKTPTRHRGVSEDASDLVQADAQTAVEAGLHLTPLATNPKGPAITRLVGAELRLALKGLSWLWYLVTAGLIVAGVALPVEDAAQWVLPLAWVWPVLVWSEMGGREVEHKTDQLVFTAPHPLQRQLVATWLAGLTTAVVAGSGVVARYLIEGDGAGIITWILAAVFIPSLALALGTWSGSAKLFQITYLSLWYAGPIQGVRRLDFMGINADAIDTTVLVLPAIAILLTLSWAGRRHQIQN